VSAVRIDTTNIIIAPFDVFNQIAQKSRYLQYDNAVLEKIVLEVVAEYVKVVKPNNDISIFDDELLFDDIYDYMLKKLEEIFSTADIAFIVNDVMCFVEDIFFDKGLIQYAS
jgi:hypothetical protein